MTQLCAHPPCRSFSNYKKVSMLCFPCAAPRGVSASRQCLLRPFFPRRKHQDLPARPSGELSHSVSFARTLYELPRAAKTRNEKKHQRQSTKYKRASTGNRQKIAWNVRCMSLGRGAWAVSDDPFGRRTRPLWGGEGGTAGWDGTVYEWREKNVRSRFCFALPNDGPASAEETNWTTQVEKFFFLRRDRHSLGIRMPARSHTHTPSLPPLC